jgi:hypothetical protein
MKKVKKAKRRKQKEARKLKVEKRERGKKKQKGCKGKKEGFKRGYRRVRGFAKDTGSKKVEKGSVAGGTKEEE